MVKSAAKMDKVDVVLCAGRGTDRVESELPIHIQVIQGSGVLVLDATAAPTAEHPAPKPFVLAMYAEGTWLSAVRVLD